MIADYWIVRRRELDVADLVSEREHAYTFDSLGAGFAEPRRCPISRSAFDVSFQWIYEVNLLLAAVTGVADAPSVNVTNVTGAEDGAIPLGINVALADTDGSESITAVTIGEIGRAHV